MQNIVRFLEQRGQQNIPDLDDIEYRQQATAFFPGAISAIASTILAAIFFLADLTSLAWFTLFIGASQAASVVIATYRPQFTTGAGTMLGLVTVLGNLGIHAEAGGYDAELWALAWLPLFL